MQREAFSDKEVERVINSKVTPIIIDIDNPNTNELVKYFKISATPTTIMLDSQRKVIDYAVGKIGKKENY